MSRSAFVIPGQGGYLSGVFADLMGYPAIRETLDIVDRTAAGLGRRPVSPLLTDLGAPAIQELVADDPASLHLAIYATSVATARTLIEHHDIVPDLVIGHSFGEIAALAVAGVFTVADGARIAALRDEALQRFAPVPGGMVAVGAPVHRAEHVIGAIDAWDLRIATDNAPAQVVISGPDDQLERLIATAAVIGVTATRLRVAYPFHNHLLAAAAEYFSRSIADVDRHVPRIRMYSPLLSRFVDDISDVDAVITGHLTAPARFLAAVRTVHSAGVTRFVECGAKSVCTDLVDTIVVGAETFAPLRTRVDAAAFESRIQQIRTGTPAPEPISATVPAEPVSRTAPAAGPAPTVTAELDPDAVIAAARDIYAELVGYPPAAFTPDADLESDLGIDSIKQTEVFGKVLAHYGLSMPNPAPRLTNHPTLLAISRLVVAIHNQQTA